MFLKTVLKNYFPEQFSKTATKQALSFSSLKGDEFLPQYVDVFH